MNTKFLVVALSILILITIGAGMLTVVNTHERVEDVPPITEKPLPPSPVTDGKLKADTFTGTLELVDTGCFADGECFVTVDGKHVTALQGFSTEMVGSVRGVSGFGDLETFVGQTVEVYAQMLPDGTYTLYGSEGFYIKPLGTDEAVILPEPGIAVGEPNPSLPRDGETGEDEPKPQVVQGGCMVGGCSGQVCTEADRASDVVTTCEYRAEYGCYQTATCERQADGQCGWTTTAELSQCLLEAQANPMPTDLEVQ